MEADLTTDAFVETKTWNALCEMVGFEDDTHLGEWRDHPRRKRTFDRALALRFRALGFIEEPEA